MNQIYCSNCGQLISNSSNFCKYCGAPQHGPRARFRVSDPVVDKPQLVTNLPKQAQRQPVDYVTKRHLGPDALWYFIVNIFGKSFVLFALLLLGAVLMPWPMAIALVVYAIALLIVSLLIYNNFTFEIDADGLKIEQGIVHRFHVSVPFEQIQNVNIERSITDRLFGLSRVSVETAGQTNGLAQAGSLTKSKAEAFLPGLHVKDAENIHDLLIDGADGVHGN